jgi:membrane fusion protein
MPLWVFTFLAVLFATVLVAFLSWGEYARRERVEGYLDLDAGAARIQIKDAGTVTDIFVREGDEVEAGAQLARITYERGSAGTTTSSQQVSHELNERISGFSREQAEAEKQGQRQIEQTNRRAADLERELRQIGEEIKLQLRRVESAREDADKYQQLVNEHFVSDSQARQKRDELIDQQVKLEGLKRQRTAIERELRSSQIEVRNVESQTLAKIEQIKRQASEVQEKLVQEGANRESVLRASVGGIITNIAINKGQSVSADAAFATIVPKGGGLHAQLLVPTRAIGFVQPGQDVDLRYEAFPYQRFGQYRGKVIEAGRTVWSAGEKLGPLAAREPVYRVDVALARQQVVFGEQRFDLRPGMLINADLLLERRSIFEWLFEPVLAFREQLRNGNAAAPAEAK